jgi:predicted DNA-binding WGR domain protein
MCNRTYLECRDSLRNKQRFYAIHVTKTIFGEWAVIKEWGRIGSPGTVREEWFDEESQAISKVDSIVKLRVKHGYCLLP